MNSFYKVVGIVRIIFMELMILIFFIGFISNLAKDIEENAVKEDLVYLISTGIIGSLCMFWLIKTMFNPRITTESGSTNILTRYQFKDFCSTHPSYVFVDVFIILWAFAFSEFDSNTTFEIYRKYATFAVGGFIPVLRLFLWYVIGLKYSKEFSKGAWKPIMWFYVILSPFVLMYVISTLLNA
jgi:hypothetical protein